MKKTLTLFALLLLLTLGAANNAFAVKLNNIGYPKEGYYYIHIGFGTGGDKLYFDRNANWKWIKWGKNGSVWYLRKDKNTGAYRIELAEDSSYFIHIDGHSDQHLDLPPDGKGAYAYLWYFHDYGNNNYVIELGEQGSKAKKGAQHYQISRCRN